MSIQPQTGTPQGSGGYGAKLTHGLLWLLLLNLIIKPFWILGIEVGVQNAVGHEEYGFYFAIFNLSYIFNILLDLGTTNYNTRNIARHPHLIAKHFPSILSIKLMLLVLYLASTFLTGLLLGYGSRQFLILAILSFNQFLSSLILFLRSNFEGLLLFKWDSILSVLDRVVMILICGVLLWVPGMPPMRIEYLALAQTAAYLVTVAVAAFVLMHNVKLHRPRFNPALSRVIVRQSLPFALLVLLMASYNRIDPVLLQHLAPDGDLAAGIYAGGFRLLDALSMIPYLVSVALLPIFARQTHSDRQSLPDTLRGIFSLMLLFSVTAAVTLSFLSGDIIPLFFDHQTEALSLVFQPLIYSIIPISFTYVFGTLLTANGNLRLLNILALVSLAVNIIVNLLFIPRWGAVGSAFASIAAQSFMAVAQAVAALRILHIKVPAVHIIRLSLFVAAVVAANLLLNALELSWMLHLAIAAAIALLLALPLKMLQPALLVRYLLHGD